MKIDINLNIRHHHIPSDGQDSTNIIIELLTQLISLNKKQHKTMSQAIDELKAKIAAQGEALDAVSTNVSGIATDQQFLKDKIQELIDAGGGATQVELQELNDAVDAQGAKIAAINTATADLDASTDSSEEEEEEPIS